MSDPRAKPTPWHSANGVRPNVSAGDVPPRRSAIIEKRIKPNHDDDGDTWTYSREGDTATLRVDLSRFADPENAAGRLLMACDELAGMIYDQGANQ